MQISKETLKALINLTHAASSDETRSHLCAIHIKDGRATATDGHIMAWHINEELKGIECSIEVDTLLKFKKAPWLLFNLSSNTCFDGTMTAPIGAFHSSIDTITKAYGTAYDEKLEHGVSPEGKPLTQHLVHTKIGLNPWLLERVARALGVPKHKGFRLVIKDHTAPIQIHSFDDGFRAVIMPMRV